jgi:hypothetical protein
MTKLVRHYLVDRDNPSIFVTTPEQFSRPMFGTVGPSIKGLEGVHTLTDENNIQFFLATCPDETVIEETEGLKVLTQEEWDAEIAAYDARQESKRWGFIRKYRNQLLEKSDWTVIRSKETGEHLSAAFKNWRRALRDLPTATTFPTSLPVLPEGGDEGVVIDQEIYDAYVAELRSIPMVNDPLPPVSTEDDSIGLS